MDWTSPVTASWAQTIITGLTALVVLWYTLETSWLRKETEKTIRISTRPVVIPVFRMISSTQMGFFLKNSGTGCATNVRVEPIRVELSREIEEFMGQNEIRFDSLEYLEAGEENPVNHTVFVEGKKTRESPFDHWFYPRYPSAHKMVIRIICEDIERRRYEIVVTILPENDLTKLPRQVEIGAIKQL